MTIHELQFKVKESVLTAKEGLESREIYIMLLIVLVGLSSFGLGRLSRLEGRKVPIQISNAIPLESPQTASAASIPPLFRGGDEGGVSSSVKDKGVMRKDSDGKLAGGQLVASKSGTKYHFPWCAGAQQISEKNKIWFNAPEEARKGGYTPASNCKGLR